MRKGHPIGQHAAGCALAVGAGAILLGQAGLSPLTAYLVAVNAATFVVYGYDKRKAGAGGIRVPELVLHVLALFGGSPAALVGQAVFRHKTRKLKFRVVFLSIVVVQVVLASGYWWWIGREVPL